MHRNVIIISALLPAAAAAACSEPFRTPTQPEVITVPLQVASGQHAGVSHNHRAHLSGDEEVFSGPAPTPADSQAQGQAIIQISKSGDSFDYKLIDQSARVMLDELLKWARALATMRS